MNCTGWLQTRCCTAVEFQKCQTGINTSAISWLCSVWHCSAWLALCAVRAHCWPTLKFQTLETCGAKLEWGQLVSSLFWFLGLYHVQHFHLQVLSFTESCQRCSAACWMSSWLPAQPCQLLSWFCVSCGMAANECALSPCSDNKRVKNTSSLLTLRSATGTQLPVGFCTVCHKPFKSGYWAVF